MDSVANLAIIEHLRCHKLPIAEDERQLSQISFDWVFVCLIKLLVK